LKQTGTVQTKEALGILILCRKECYDDLFKSGDELIKYLKKNKYKPGSENCHVLFGEACASCGVGHGHATTVAQTAAVAPTAAPLPVGPKVMPPVK